MNRNYHRTRLVLTIPPMNSAKKCAQSPHVSDVPLIAASLPVPAFDARSTVKLYEKPLPSLQCDAGSTKTERN